MSQEQLPKALQLAAMFDHPLPPDWGEMQAAAAELRRLNAREDELLHHVCVLQGMNNESLESIRALTAELEQARAALAAQGEPVGEVFTMEALGTTPGKPFCHVLLNRTLPTGTKLYTAAPAKPMTREQAMAIVQSNPDTMTAIRMTEAHHGITDKGGA
ncbi:hypothetical protein [Aquabacterium sp.]|uniref:hypothetical protein n=1 Tax=Aquabacterium sp. TaxID=1872578 RepID=UPI0035AF6CB9